MSMHFKVVMLSQDESPEALRNNDPVFGTWDVFVSPHVQDIVDHDIPDCHFVFVFGLNECKNKLTC